jgi:hypothetical protein
MRHHTRKPECQTNGTSASYGIPAQIFHKMRESFLHTFPVWKESKRPTPLSPIKPVQYFAFLLLPCEVLHFNFGCIHPGVSGQFLHNVLFDKFVCSHGLRPRLFHFTFACLLPVLGTARGAGSLIPLLDIFKIIHSASVFALAFLELMGAYVVFLPGGIRL